MYAVVYDIAVGFVANKVRLFPRFLAVRPHYRCQIGHRLRIVDFSGRIVRRIDDDGGNGFAFGFGLKKRLFEGGKVKRHIGFARNGNQNSAVIVGIVGVFGKKRNGNQHPFLRI